VGWKFPEQGIEKGKDATERNCRKEPICIGGKCPEKVPNMMQCSQDRIKIRKEEYKEEQKKTEKRKKVGESEVIDPAKDPDSLVPREGIHATIQGSN
jgi:hypothetical protein